MQNQHNLDDPHVVANVERTTAAMESLIAGMEKDARRRSLQVVMECANWSCRMVWLDNGQPCPRCHFPHATVIS